MATDDIFGNLAMPVRQPISGWYAYAFDIKKQVKKL